MADSIKTKAASGMVWAIGERLLTQGTLFLVSIVLARLLTPNEYGILAILLVFTNLADVLVTNGMGEALVQKQNVEDIDYSTVFLSAMILALFLYGLIFFSANLIASFYGNGDLEIYLQVLAIRIPLSALNAVQKAYISKNFLFQKQFFASFVGSFVSGIVAIMLAWFGFGVYALIAQQLLSLLLISGLLALITKWVPHLGFNPNSFKSLVPLGLQFCGASLVNSIYTEGRSLLIGKFYSSADLAYFNRGNQFPALVVDNLNAPMSSVILPVLAEIKTNGREIKFAVRKAAQISSFIVFPLMGMLFVSASNLVSFLLGAKWLESVPYLQIACVFYLFQPLQTINWQVLKSLGKGQLCIKLEILKKVLCFAMLLFAVPNGVIAISIASALAGFLSCCINIVPNRRLIGYGLFQQIVDVFKPLFATVVASIIASLFLHLHVAPLLGLLMQLLVGLAMYLIICRFIKCEGFELIRAELLK